jgi:Leucine-rich repeat (LRR) protein
MDYTTDNFFSEKYDLTPDLWAIIFNYLNPLEIAQLKITRNMTAFINSEKINTLLLASLSKMDPSIPSVFSPYTQYNKLNNLINHFEKINIRQMEEIDYLQKSHPLTSFCQTILAAMQGPTTTLAMLLERHLALDTINISFILTKLNAQSTHLNLSKLNITRIPDSILYYPNLERYWAQLEKFSCDNNLLISLPNSIGRLQQLQTLHFGNNKITTFPDTIVALVNLNTLVFQNNQICHFPEKMGNLTKLTFLNCADNQIICFPESMNNLINLKVIYLQFNYLTKLPSILLKQGCSLGVQKQDGLTKNASNTSRAFIPKFLSYKGQTPTRPRRPVTDDTNCNIM